MGGGSEYSPDKKEIASQRQQIEDLWNIAGAKQPISPFTVRYPSGTPSSNIFSPIYTQSPGSSIDIAPSNQYKNTKGV